MITVIKIALIKINFNKNKYQYGIKYCRVYKYQSITKWNNCEENVKKM